MKGPLSARVHRVEVTEDVARRAAYDYADSFEVQLPHPDPDRPQTWVLAGLNEVPALVDRVARWLGVDQNPVQVPGQIDGWDVIESTADVIQLEQTVPLMHVVLVGRRLGASGRRLTSVLYFKRPVAARLVWTQVGVGHRRMVRRLLTGAGSTTVRSSQAARAA